MSSKQEWALASAVIAIVIGALVWFFVATKPDCPEHSEHSETKWTRQGWYCVVPPKGRT